MIEHAAGDAGGAFAVLAWSVKATFCAYVARLADGVCEVSEGVRLLGRGRYGLPGAVVTDADEFQWRSSATLSFQAHGGLMRVSLHSPVLTLGESRGSLAIAPGDPGSEPKVIGDIESVSWQGDRIVGRPVLTEAGAALFGGYYSVGEPLDEFELILSSGAIDALANPTER